jgi:hypothetical protein
MLVLPQRSAAQELRSSKIPASHVPADDAEVYRVYFTFIQGCLFRFGIDKQDCEDVAMTILAKFIEKGVLADFDPERQHEREGQIFTAVFRTFLSGFVLKYALHYRTMQGRRHKREPFSGDEVTGGNNAGKATQQSWFEMNGDHVLDTDEHDAVEGEMLLDTVRHRLSLVPPANAGDRLPFVALFDYMLVQYDEIGRISPTGIAEHFEVSKNTAQAWVKRIRPHVREILDAA